MNNNTAMRARVAALVFSMVNAVIFGAGIVAVLSIPALSAHAFLWIPAVVVTSLVLSAPLSWLVAPTMMLRFMRASHFVHARPLGSGSVAGR